MRPHRLTNRVLDRRGDTTDAWQPAGRLLSIYVVATTPTGTRAALAAAQAHARGLAARIVLLVPHVVPYAQALEHPADPTAFPADRYRGLAEELGIDVAIRICLCRGRDAVASLIPHDAVVLLGGRRRRWWPTREERAAGTLTKAGYRVLFVAARSAA